MLKIGDHVELDIHTVAFGGNGIGRVLDLVVFVPFTAVGDRCQVKITAIKKNYLIGHLEKLLNPSPSRTAPLCHYYQICGGCQYQHIGYTHQIASKERQFRETLERIGKIQSPNIKAMIPSPQIYHYRGKADFQIQYLKGGLPKVGFIDTAGSTAVNIARCEIVDESINKNLPDLRRNLLARKSVLTGARYTIWSDLNNQVKSTEHNNIYPPKYIERFVKGKRLQIPFGGFFQINNALVDALVDTVGRMCDLTGTERVLDCYCGSGLFAIFLAPQAGQIYGIDSDGSAIRCARINCRTEDIKHVKFYQGDASVVLDKEFVQAKIPIDCVILDPPRSGCEKDALKAIIALNPKRLIYISCNPATQARDIHYLIDHGFSLNYVQPLDMFPQTQHIEAVALLEYQ